jgi:hypothetical protein
VFTPTADHEVHITDVWLDDYDDGDYGLDLDAAPAGTREALELLQPLIDDEAAGARQVAERAQVPLCRVTAAVAQVRAAARQQGLAPDGEERRELADRVAELRRRRLTYQQIADALGLRSYHTARALLADFHPEALKQRAKSNGNSVAV